MVILGIDPGTQRIGYGVIKKDKGKLQFLAAGLLKVKSKDIKTALKEAHLSLQKLIQTWRPDVLATEKLFFAKNRKTALAVAQTRGVIMLTAAESGLPCLEYSPNEVKLGITGYGKADKKAVAKMVRLALAVPELKALDDTTDALAIAILAGHTHRIFST